MFLEYESLTKIEFISIDTSKVKSMRGLFYMWNNLEYLDLTKFNTSNVRDMLWMFSRCSKLKEINVINRFNLKNCINKSSMFDGCKELDYLTVSYSKIITDNKKFIEKNQNSISVMFFYLNKIFFILYLVKNLILSQKNIYYFVNSNTVDKTVTLKENKIKNGDTILVQFIED